MGNRIIDDVTGEELQADEVSSFRATLSLRLDPSGHESLRLETPAIFVKRTSRNIVDNAAYQDFLADVAPLTDTIDKAWTRFWNTYKQKLKE